MEEEELFAIRSIFQHLHGYLEITFQLCKYRKGHIRKLKDKIKIENICLVSTSNFPDFGDVRIFTRTRGRQIRRNRVLDAAFDRLRRHVEFQRLADFEMRFDAVLGPVRQFAFRQFDTEGNLDVTGFGPDAVRDERFGQQPVIADSPCETKKGFFKLESKTKMGKLPKIE